MQNDAGMNVDLYIPRKWRVEKDPEEFMAFVSASAPCNVQGAPLAAGPCDRHLIVRANSSFNSTRAARLRELIPPDLSFLHPPLCQINSSWTRRLISAKDHASVQINVGEVDPATGRYTGNFKTFALCGYIRDKVGQR